MDVHDLVDRDAVLGIFELSGALACVVTQSSMVERIKDHWYDGFHLFFPRAQCCKVVLRSGPSSGSLFATSQPDFHSQC